MDRVFQIAAGASVTFENVEITGGIADDDDTGSSAVEADGGGILSDGSLTLDNVVVTGNKALATVAGENAQGGGVYATGSLTVLGGSLIEGNSAVVAAGRQRKRRLCRRWRRFFVDSRRWSTLAARRSRTMRPWAEPVPAATTAAKRSAVESTSATAARPAVLLNDDTITGNQVVGGTGGAGAAGGLSWGGGVAVDLGNGTTGAPVVDHQFHALLQHRPRRCRRIRSSRRRLPTAALPIFLRADRNCSNDTVYGNSAIGGGGTTAGNAVGGGIVDDTGVDSVQGLSLVNVTVAFNVAQAGTPAAGGTAGSGAGGGINNDSGDSSLAVSNSLFAENTADFGPDVYGAAATTDHNLVGVYDGTVASGFSALERRPVGNQRLADQSPARSTAKQWRQHRNRRRCWPAARQSMPATMPRPRPRVVDRSARHRFYADRGRQRSTSARTKCRPPLATTTTLSPITSPSNVGQSVTLSATVSATGTPTGTVTFEDTINGVTTTARHGSACPAAWPRSTVLSLPGRQQ